MHNWKIRNTFETFTGEVFLIGRCVVVFPGSICINRISEIVVERFFSSSNFLPDWLYHWTPHGREHTKILERLHGFTSKVSTTLLQVRTLWYC